MGRDRKTDRVKNNYNQQNIAIEYIFFKEDEHSPELDFNSPLSSSLKYSKPGNIFYLIWGCIFDKMVLLKNKLSLATQRAWQE